MKTLLLLSLLVVLTPFPAEGNQLGRRASSEGTSLAADRSSTARRHFAKEHPCPATKVAKPDHCYSTVEGKRVSYVIDHVVPLCAGGADSPVNMQWSRLEISKLKDRVEKATCHCVKKYGKEAGCPVIDWKAQPAAKR